MDELQELLTQLVGKLKEDDLEDPNIQVLMEQLQAILYPKSDKMPQELVESLSRIPDKRERFKQAAIQLGLQTAEELKELADSMKMSGLLQ